MSNSVEMEVRITSADLLSQAIASLGAAIQDLRQANETIRTLETCEGEKVRIDYLIQNEIGEKIGVRETEKGTLEMVLPGKETETVRKTINNISQAYARLKILDEVKRKGYKSVKEEKLANGSIRLVVEKWR